jgi:uncharacterized membrane protein YfcA
MTSLQLTFLLFSGLAAGLLGSLLGLGGGILIVPILALALKIPMHNAIATSLLCVIATSSAAASKNVRIGLANVRLGMSLEVWTVLGAIAGSAIAGVLPDRALMFTFAIAMALMALPMARGIDSRGSAASVPPTKFGESLSGTYYDGAEKREVAYAVKRVPVAMATSGLAGILSGLLGVGGGIVKVPILTLYCGVPMKAAAATSNFIIGVTAAASAVIYYGRGDVSPMISAASVLGVFIGSRAGTVVTHYIHGNTLRRVFAIVMLIIAAQMLARATGVMAR